MFDYISFKVQEDSTGVIGGRKLYIFWIVWPHDKNATKCDNEKENKNDDDSDVEEVEHKEREREESSTHPTKHKDLKQVNESCNINSYNCIIMIKFFRL